MPGLICHSLCQVFPALPPTLFGQSLILPCQFKYLLEEPLAVWLFVAPVSHVPKSEPPFQKIAFQAEAVVFSACLADMKASSITISMPSPWHLAQLAIFRQNHHKIVYLSSVICPYCTSFVCSSGISCPTEDFSSVCFATSTICICNYLSSFQPKAFTGCN